jgi:hypothetical protein
LPEALLSSRNAHLLGFSLRHKLLPEAEAARFLPKALLSSRNTRYAGFCLRHKQLPLVFAITANNAGLQMGIYF